MNNTDAVFLITLKCKFIVFDTRKTHFSFTGDYFPRLFGIFFSFSFMTLLIHSHVLEPVTKKFKICITFLING